MVNTILGLIYSILYNILVSPLFGVIDILQAIFQGFAGTGTIMSGSNVITNVNDGGDKTTGIVYYLLRSGAVQNLFYALLALAIVLLVLFTMIAFVKNIYAEKPKPWKDILTSSIKGLAGFFLTPIVCLFGVWVGNILLQVLFQATSDGGSRTMSSEVFVAGAYNANRMRLKSAFNTEWYINGLNEVFPNDPTVKKYKEGKVQEVDKDGNLLWEDEEKTKPKYKTVTSDDMTDSEREHLAALADSMFRGVSGDTLDYGWGKTLLIHDQTKITVFYESTQINYLLMVVGSIFMIYALGAISFGAVKRLFYLVFLFVLSPLMNAMYPIDDGQAAKGLNKDFYKQTIGVYSAVVGLNLFYAILPMITQVGYVDGLIGAAGNGIFSVIIMICGLLTVKELIGLIDGYIGSSGVYAAGTSMMASVKGQLSKYGKKAGKVVGEFGKANAARKTAKERGASGGAAFLTGLKTIGLDAGKGISKVAGDWTGINPDAWIQDWKKGSKEGVEAYREISGKKDNKKELKDIDNMSVDDLKKKYGTDNREEAKQVAKSPYTKAKVLARGDGVAAVGNDQEKIIEQIQKAIDAIKKLDEKDQKPMLETLAKSLGKDGHADMTSQTWYKEGMSAEDAVAAAQHYQNIQTLNAQLGNARARGQDLDADRAQYNANQTEISTLESRGINAHNGSYAERTRYQELQEQQLELEKKHNTVGVDGEVTEGSGKELLKSSITEESMRQLAVTIGEQLARALQGAESTTNGNAKFAEFANNISASLKSTMESLQAKGGKSDDKLASTLEKLSAGITKLPEDIKKAVKQAMKEKKPGGGGGST